MKVSHFLLTTSFFVSAAGIQQEEYGVLDKKLEFWRANIKSKSPKPAELLAVYYIVYI
ncbi:hypothetical protein PVAP13_5NG276781 [Panicum virgatum]|uniref:Uncharacterized protein n=1 Tax=Panicum virgatum TaxID=38727 RepID=A0A8T0RXW7_PANVG|nr:hypothetical protein PVAP13_5NG276781 [Panicum virgatum]